MTWHGPSGNCGCCGGNCDIGCKCIASICSDENGNVLNTELYEWLFVVTYYHDIDLDMYLSGLSPIFVASIIDVFEEGVTKSAIITSDISIVENYLKRRDENGYCLPKHVREAEIILFDKSILGKLSYSVIFKENPGGQNILGVDFSSVLYDKSSSSFINFSGDDDELFNDVCGEICIDLDENLVYTNNDVIDLDVYESIGYGCYPLNKDELDSQTGIIKGCGVDLNGELIIAKKTLSSQLELNSSLSNVFYSRFFDFEFGGCQFTGLRKWELIFSKQFTGTYPGVFCNPNGESDSEDYCLDNNPYECGKNPYTLFHIETIPIDLVLNDYFIIENGSNPNSTGCPMFVQYSVPYKGLARIIGDIAVDEYNGPQPFETKPRIICELYKYIDVDWIDNTQANPFATMDQRIQSALWHSPTDIYMIIRSGTDACSGVSLFQNAFGRLDWEFPGVNFTSIHRHIFRGPGGGTQIQQVNWDQTYIQNNIDPLLIPYTFQLGTGTMYNGFKIDYRAYYCPNMYGSNPCIYDIPRDVSKTEIDNNVSCINTQGFINSTINPLQSYGSSILLNAARSGILQ